jgi:hypothetical protein
MNPNELHMIVIGILYMHAHTQPSACLPTKEKDFGWPAFYIYKQKSRTGKCITLLPFL